MIGKVFDVFESKWGRTVVLAVLVVSIASAVVKAWNNEPIDVLLVASLGAYVLFDWSLFTLRAWVGCACEH